MSSTTHLIYGPTAAGKSTYARRLAEERRAVRLAIDEWMLALFTPDQPDKLSLDWIVPRVARCRQVMWATSQRILATGTEVVLEFGLLREADRDQAVAQVEQAGHAVTLSFVDASLEERRRRVQARNLARGETFSFEVTPLMFDTMEGIFERPSAAELARARVVSTEDHHA